MTNRKMKSVRLDKETRKIVDGAVKVYGFRSQGHMLEVILKGYAINHALGVGAQMERKDGVK